MSFMTKLHFGLQPFLAKLNLIGSFTKLRNIISGFYLNLFLTKNKRKFNNGFKFGWGKMRFTNYSNRTHLLWETVLNAL